MCILLTSIIRSDYYAALSSILGNVSTSTVPTSDFADLRPGCITVSDPLALHATYMQGLTHSHTAISNTVGRHAW